VAVHGVVAEEEPFRDLLVREAVRDEAQDLDLPPGEGAGGRTRPIRRRLGGHRLQDLSGPGQLPLRLQLGQQLQRVARFVRGGLPPAKPGEGVRQLQPGAGHLEGSSRPQEPVDRVLEVLPRLVGMTTADRHMTCGHAGQSTQRGRVGPRRYLTYYLVAVLAAGLTQLLVTAATGPLFPTVGASGGVFGLLLAYAIYFPRNKVFFLLLPVPIPARVFVFIYAAVELFLGVTGTQEGVAHFAHLGGLVGGALMLAFWRRGRLIRS